MTAGGHNPADDCGLLERVARGDQSAFAAFYDRHAARVYGFLVRALGRGREADDVLQDVFWQVWSRVGQFDRERGTPVQWLALLTRSRALDALRRRRSAATESDARLSGVAVDGAVDSPASTRELSSRARAALKALPQDQRKAIEMAFFDGLTHQQIAEQGGWPLGTVKTRIRLGMQKMRELIAGPSADFSVSG